MDRENFVLAVLAASNGAEFSPVQTQKLFFLLDKKVPSKTSGPYFNFHPDNYGPFDSAVYRELELLAKQRCVQIEYVADLRKRTYRTSPEGQSRGEAALMSLGTDVQDYIRRLTQWILSLSFAQLVSAIYAEFPDMKAKSIFRQ